MSGWRYHGRPSLPATVGVGLFSGFGGGAAQIAGPAVIIYWLSTSNHFHTVRANLLVYFLLLDVTLCVSYFVQGVFTPELVALAFLLGVAVFRRDLDRRDHVPRHFGSALPPHRLCDHRRRRVRQLAAVRPVVSLVRVIANRIAERVSAMSAFLIHPRTASVRRLAAASSQGMIQCANSLGAANCGAWPVESDATFAPGTSSCIRR